MAASENTKARAAALVAGGESKASVARSLNVNVNTVTRWVEEAKRNTQQTEILERAKMLTEMEPQTETPEPDRRTKRKRTLLGTRNVLTYEGEDPRYVHRVVVEDDRRVGRVEQFKEAGWEPVRGEQLGDAYVDNSKTPGSVTGKPVGMGATGYLMRKLKDEEEADLAYVADSAKAKEEQIFTDLNDPNKPNQFGSLSVGSRKEQRR